ncbi:MAG: UDP-N-acetylmuramoyl-tripeptide--D-alanyl-D-alanine ligase [Anaerolineae bacterium]
MQLPTILTTVIFLIWLIGTWLRTYQQIRFYQIEEYMSLRYLRWLLSERQRWLPVRVLGVWGAGSIFALINDSIPGETAILPYLIASIASIIAVIPPREQEIKKAFVRTQRASRMLGTALILALITLILSTHGLNLANFGSDRLNAVLSMGIGFAVWVLSPLWLMLGNLLMTPIERAIRQRYIRQAKEVLATIQPKVIGITGSYGKTTTKNFLRDVLNGRYKTYATPKSYNTMMGVTLAINTDLANDYSIEYFISEMGAYVEGEITRICQLTPPDISIVTEVGPQHLERFGSLENIATAKYEIIANLAPHGLGVFNWDNPYVRQMYERGYPDNRLAISRTLSVKEASQQGVRFIATDIKETLNGLSFSVHDTLTGTEEVFSTPVVGEHNVTNLLLTTAVAVHEGMSLHEVKFRVSALQPAESRLVRKTTSAGITIINDAYSANPVGIVSSLKVLGMHQTGKRLLITPGMVELGELHKVENRKLGEIATQYATDIILIGSKQTQPIQDGILSTEFDRERLHIFETLTEATDWYQAHLSAGDTVLFLNDLPDTY